MDLKQITATLNPELVARFKEAIAIGRWADGRKLTEAQRETCLQAVIAYEHQHMPETERTGYVPPKTSPCAPEDEEHTITWRE